MSSLFIYEMMLLVTSQCQTCDQLITGRNLEYNRALEIIQNEEYLDGSDFDEIKVR
jgi:hypothetical protein